MIRVRPIVARHRMAGLSLIEMMIALIMALIVAAGIITVFASTSSSNKVQQQMAALQEEGRFAIHSLRNDLANANGGYCSNSGGKPSLTGSGLYLDALRTPTIHSEANIAPSGNLAAVLPDNTVGLPDPTGTYSLPSSLFMRGYECTAASCTPSMDNLAPGIPATGTDVGDRVLGTDALTIRYLKPGSGWAIVPDTSTGTHMATVGGTTTITLHQLQGEESVANFTGGLAMLADCSDAQVFAISNTGSGTLTVLGAGNPGNFAQPNGSLVNSKAAPRVFDFIHDFQTVTYYLRVVDAGNGHTTGELVRRLNGVDQPMVRGIERLDFRYGIINADGNTQYLTADQVDSTPASDCPPGVSIPGGMPATGCLWRAIQTIEVNILMDGQTPLYTLTPAEMNYIYTPDGDTTPQPPTSATRAVQPSVQGFPNQLLRREFTTVISLRNFNP